ncbi:hypothetical protein RTBOTA2_004333 [Rhodotorula toruloides]|uniref:Uncharacterized protein n=1 Tax=Rhodotorula toruloides TaxID=5286 RepID=A0A0K3C8B2_RHOTO|nr:hypothetical protein RTBOTA2_004333 [Rhodotorula toruloides]PRQ78088.1 hypothetical protein AAT19DRAFT_9156 [Rhodotorula toruloides]
MSGQSSFNRAKFATQSWQVISTLVCLTPLAPIPCAIYGGRWMAIIDLLLVVIAIMGIRSSYIDFNVANASLNSIKASLANMNTQFWVSVTVPYCLFVGFAVWVIWDRKHWSRNMSGGAGGGGMGGPSGGAGDDQSMMELGSSRLRGYGRSDRAALLGDEEMSVGKEEDAWEREVEKRRKKAARRMREAAQRT